MKTQDWKKSLSAFQAKQLEIYAKALYCFNKTISLFSRRKERDFCQELILDSLLAGRILLKDSSQDIISDIGSGAGFPGLVLAVLDPTRKIWLFEPNRKKSWFLEYTSWKMGLQNIYVKSIPIQEEKTLLNCAVSKAFLSLSARLALTSACFKEGAVYYHFHTPGWKNQWEKASGRIKKIWEIKSVGKYSHSDLPGQKVLLKTIKLKLSPGP